MNPSGELTLGDLLLTLGERHSQVDYGTGSDNRPVIKADPATRDRLLRAINNGRREVYSRMPEARCFQPRLQVVMDPTGLAANIVNKDPAKYQLPYAVQGLAGGQWTWTLPDTTGYGRPVRQVHQSDLAAMHYTANVGGLTTYPTALAFTLEALSNPSEPGRRMSSFLWVFPKPDKAYVLEGQVRVMYAPLVALTDLEPMGQEHLETILAFATRDWKVGRCEQDEWASIQARCEEAIGISINLDNARGAQNLGTGYDPDSQRESLKYSRGRYYPERAAMVDFVSGIPTGI